MRSISVSPCGYYLASGDEDGQVLIWEIETTRVIKKYKMKNKVVDCVEWCPNKAFCFLAVANEEHVTLINPMLYAIQAT